MNPPTQHHRPVTIALCVGEASGDLLGAHLMDAIKQRCPQARFIGIGGPRMLARGFESLYEQEKLAVRGFAEVVKRLPEILSIRKGLVRDMKNIRPDVFVGIDAPDFNLGVAEKLKKAGIPTVHYVSPSVWAWRRERVNTIIHQVNRVLCLFPMEPELYRQAGGQAEFVGHPMAQTMPLEADQQAARRRMKIEGWETVFCLMPGSRVSEIDYMAPIFFRTAKLLLQRYPSARFLLPVATVATRQRLLQILDRPEFRALPIQLMSAHADLACTAADVVLVTSGTATLEVALCKRPMVISYKISPLTYAYVKRKITVPHVGLPNILLGKGAVPELLQHDAEPEKLAAAVAEWYESPEDVAALKRDFHELHLLLKKDTAALAAQAVLAEAGIQMPK
ncbi:lipid-A-disaccharide synthase [Neisseria dumasiana]|uniref:Lipid-A-disaccharide synthase n=1 Tax=Neisseria dumasiana TaxID=1931275 RepID=A0ABX3WMS7_9NEIS|nr:lipid-A-disaccharide synthase [Neisseria dumasiana]OSI36004.1 lipid-A-disaccharide synthase [Neisseria dumasiana]UOO84606.1 lipid-A-disaccharide synthase [Neisseria dumasiana]